MAEKCEFEERVCVDCEITVDCQCDVAKKKKNLKRIRFCKAVFKALGSRLCFRSPLVILSQSLGRKKAQLQTRKQTAGSYTEHSSQILLGQHFQVPFKDSFRIATLCIRSLRKQMPDKFVSGVRCGRLMVIGNWNNFCQDLQGKGGCLYWKHSPLSAA